MWLYTSRDPGSADTFTELACYCQHCIGFLEVGSLPDRVLYGCFWQSYYKVHRDGMEWYGRFVYGFKFSEDLSPVCLHSLAFGTVHQVLCQFRCEPFYTETVQVMRHSFVHGLGTLRLRWWMRWGCKVSLQCTELMNISKNDCLCLATFASSFFRRDEQSLSVRN